MRSGIDIPKGASLENKTVPRILVLYCLPTIARDTRLTLLHHLHALDLILPRERVVYCNADNVGAPAWLRQLNFDAVILHYSFLAMRFNPLSYFERWKAKVAWIADLQCVKVAIPQDEYDRSGILDSWLNELHISAVMSIFGPSSLEIQQLYPITSGKADFYRCFTGYIHNATARRYALMIKPIADRSLDLVYRARNLPYWFGSHGQLKREIADVVGSHARQKGFRCDISTSEQDAILGEAWIGFMASGKATIGSMSGSSVLDPFGEIQSAIRILTEQDPEKPFDEVNANLPPGWNAYHFHALGPRHFEAVLTKTCQLLIEDDYSGVLEANKHYIPIKKDYSNLDEVLDKLKDDTLLQSIVDCAYQDIYLSNKYSYEAFAQQILDVIEMQQNRLGIVSRPINERLWQVARMVNAVTERRIQARYYLRELIRKVLPGSVRRYLKKALRRL